MSSQSAVKNRKALPDPEPLTVRKKYKGREMTDSVQLRQVVEGIRKAALVAEQKYGHCNQPRDTPSVTKQKEDTSAAKKDGYEVYVYTGNYPNAGTQANVFLTLFSESGQIGGPIALTAEYDTSRDPLHYRFQRNQEDSFFVPIVPLGDIIKIRIGHDGPARGNGWYLEKVVLKDCHTQREYVFPCDRWLAVDRDDKQIVRDLPVEHAFQATPKDFTEDASEIIKVSVEASSKHGSVELKDYAPKVFRNIRELYGITTDEYVKSWTLPDENLQAKEGAGRSGSLFLKSADDKYYLKTIPTDEVATFLEVLPNYYPFLIDQRETLIMKVVGLQRYKGSLGAAMYILIFVNVLYDQRHPSLTVYDLKGRVPKPGKALQYSAKMGGAVRHAMHNLKPVQENGASTSTAKVNEGSQHIFKDKDLDRKFYLREEDKPQFVTRLHRDIRFFQQNNLMDYSLLIGVSSGPTMDEDVEYPPWVYTRISDSAKNEVYHIGFIDCLTSYGLKKKVAHFFKSALWTPETLSTIDSTSYAERIKNYLLRVFCDTSDNPYDTFTPVPRTPLNLPAPVSADALLFEKKMEMMEKRMVRLEETVRTLADQMVCLLDNPTMHTQIDRAALVAISTRPIMSPRPSHSRTNHPDPSIFFHTNSNSIKGGVGPSSSRRVSALESESITNQSLGPNSDNVSKQENVEGGGVAVVGKEVEKQGESVVRKESGVSNGKVDAAPHMVVTDLDSEDSDSSKGKATATQIPTQSIEATC